MTKNNFSEKLKELRLKNKYTQKFVAEFLGLTQRQYQYCEMGHIPSQFDVVIKMCAMYGIDANELFGIEKINIYPNYPNSNSNLLGECSLNSNALANIANISNANMSNPITDSINNYIQNRLWWEMKR